MKIFQFDNVNSELIINEHEILLISEFAVLWNNTRNITKKDPKGLGKSRAYREFAYIYLMIDWQSPYGQYTEQDRHESAIIDAALTEEEFNDPSFRAACRKYREIQESDRQIRLIKAAQNKCEEIIDYFEEGSDLMERDLVSGKPIFKAKDIMDELSKVSKVLDELDALEIRIKQKKKAESGFKAGASEGFMPKAF